MCMTCSVCAPWVDMFNNIWWRVQSIHFSTASCHFVLMSKCSLKHLFSDIRSLFLPVIWETKLHTCTENNWKGAVALMLPGVSGWGSHCCVLRHCCTDMIFFFILGHPTINIISNHWCASVFQQCLQVVFALTLSTVFLLWNNRNSWAQCPTLGLIVAKYESWHVDGRTWPAHKVFFAYARAWTPKNGYTYDTFVNLLSFWKKDKQACPEFSSHCISSWMQYILKGCISNLCVDVPCNLLTSHEHTISAYTF